MTFASKDIKNLSKLRSDKRYLEQVRSADVGQALQLKLASESPKYYPEYEATRLLNFFQVWVMESEIGMEGLAVLNPYSKNLGDVIPPWDFIWTDNYLCDPSIRPFSQISPLKRLNEYELTSELCANEGCNCEGEECDPSTCACLRRAADCYPYQGNHYQTMFAPADAHVNAEGAAAEKRDFVYGHDGRLLPGVPLGTPIFECNKSCSCSSACRNRVVQKGKKARLAFVKTPEKGWGIKALEELPVGTFVGAYGGELLSDVEAERRADVYDRKLGTTYLQTVDSHIIKVHLTRQIIERDLAARFELATYRGTAASKMKLVELVTKAADAIEVYEEYWHYLEAGNAAAGRLHAAEDRLRRTSLLDQMTIVSLRAPSSMRANEQRKSNDACCSTSRVPSTSPTALIIPTRASTTQSGSSSACRPPNRTTSAEWRSNVPTWRTPNSSRSTRRCGQPHALLQPLVRPQHLPCARIHRRRIDHATPACLLHAQEGRHR